MRRPLSVLCLCFAAFAAGCSDPYGIEEANPLGDFATMDEWLVTEKKLQRSERKFTDSECFSPERYEALSKLRVYQYEEFPQNTEGVKHWVLLAVDDGGRVRAIGGKFFSRTAGYSEKGTRVEGFLAPLWVELAGAEPTFEKRNRPGIDVDEYLHTSFDAGSIHGIWQKYPTTKFASHTRTLWDAILLWTD